MNRRQASFFSLALFGVLAAPTSALSDNVILMNFSNQDISFPINEVLNWDQDLGKHTLMSLECFRFYNPELSELDPSDDIPMGNVFLLSVQCDGPKPARYVENQPYSFAIQTGPEGGLSGDNAAYSIKSLIDADAENPLMDFEMFVELNRAANPWLDGANVDTLVEPDSVLIIEMLPVD